MARSYFLLYSHFLIGVNDVELGPRALGIAHGGVLVQRAIVLCDLALLVEADVREVLVSLLDGANEHTHTSKIPFIQSELLYQNQNHE